MGGGVTTAYVLSDRAMQPNIRYLGVKRGKYDVWCDKNQMLALFKGDLASQRITSFTYVFYDM